MACHGQILKTAPAAEPLTLSQAKAELVVDFSDDDQILTHKIAEVRSQAEAMLNRRLITQVWTLVYDRFEAIHYLPLGPVASVDEIRYRDSAGTLTTLASTEWQSSVRFEPARVMPAQNKVWPVTNDQPEAVEIDLTVGYGASGDSVPEAIMAALKLMLNGAYDKREGPATMAKNLLVPHVLHVR